MRRRRIALGGDPSALDPTRIGFQSERLPHPPAKNCSTRALLRNAAPRVFSSSILASHPTFFAQALSLIAFLRECAGAWVGKAWRWEHCADPLRDQGRGRARCVDEGECGNPPPPLLHHPPPRIAHLLPHSLPQIKSNQESPDPSCSLLCNAHPEMA